MSEQKISYKRPDALTGSTDKIDVKALEHHVQGVIRRGYVVTADVHQIFRRIIRNGDEEALKKAIWQDCPIFALWDIYESVALAVKEEWMMESICPTSKEATNNEAGCSRKRKTPTPAATPSPQKSLMKDVPAIKRGEPSLEDADLLTNLKSPKKSKYTFQFSDFEEWLNAL